MNCADAQSKFDDRLDDRLAPDEARQVEAHLALCQTCQREWDAYARVWQALESAPDIAPSTGFTARTLRRLEQTPSIVSGQFDWLLGWRGVVLAASAACLLVLAVLLISYPTRQAVLPVDVYASLQHNDQLEDYDVIEHLHELEEAEQ